MFFQIESISFSTGSFFPCFVDEADTENVYDYPTGENGQDNYHDSDQTRTGAVAVKDYEGYAACCVYSSPRSRESNTEHKEDNGQGLPDISCATSGTVVTNEYDDNDRGSVNTSYANSGVVGVVEYDDNNGGLLNISHGYVEMEEHDDKGKRNQPPNVSCTLEMEMEEYDGNVRQFVYSAPEKGDKNSEDRAITDNGEVEGWTITRL